MLNLDTQDYLSAIEWATGEYTGTPGWLGDGTTSEKIVRILKEKL